MEVLLLGVVVTPYPPPLCTKAPFCLASDLRLAAALLSSLFGGLLLPSERREGTREREARAARERTSSSDTWSVRTHSERLAVVLRYMRKEGRKGNNKERSV